MSRAPFLFVLALPLLAQVDNAALNGTVTDASRSVVPAATVEAVSSKTGFRRQATTGAAGSYQIPALPIGVYTVKISKTGFRAAEFADVELAVGQARTIDAQRSIGTMTEAVQVTAGTESMDRNSAEVGGLVEPEQIK